MFDKKRQPPIKSLIAQGTRIDGDLKFSEGLRIDGEVFGDIRAASDSPSMLVISEAAVVQGEVQADHVIVNGTVRGPIIARELLELQPNAVIHGDVSYRAIEMHKGAIMDGPVKPLMMEDEEKPLLKLAAKSA